MYGSYFTLQVPSWCKHMLYPPPIKIKNHLIGHKSETARPKKKLLHRVTYFYTFVQILGSKFKIMGATEIHHFLKSAKLTLNGPANGPVVTYSKIQNRFSRAP